MLMYDTAHKHTGLQGSAAGVASVLRGVPMVRFLSALLQVDGMDVLCVREAAQFAADHCRAGKVRV